jgi:hypothetical protein
VRRRILAVLFLTVSLHAQTPADLFLDFEAGTVTAIITPSNLTSASHGAATGTWSVVPDPLTKVTITGTNMARRTSFTVNSMTYDGAGTRAVQFTHTGDDEILNWVPPASFTDLTVSGITEIDGEGDTTYDHVNIAGGGYVVLQHIVGGIGGSAGEMHAEGQISGVTFKSAPIAVNIGRYEWHLRRKGSDGTVALVILNPTTGALIGTSGIAGADTSGNVEYVRIQDYITPDGGETVHDSMVFAWGAKALLPLDESFEPPAPTIVNVTQTAADEVRLIFTGHGISYLIERRTGAGAWGTVATYAPTGGGTGQREYLDDTVSDGTTYTYRISAIVGDYTSDPATTGSITTDNTPSGEETTYISQTASTSSASVGGSQHTLTQRIKNTLGETLWISEIELDSEFFERANPEFLFLCENEDGTGEIYGVSNALNITADGPLTFEFFTSAPVPTTGCYIRYAPVWARTQIKYTTSDVYAAGEGYNGNYNSTGGIAGDTTADLKMTVKQREPVAAPSVILVDTLSTPTLIIGAAP